MTEPVKPGERPPGMVRIPGCSFVYRLTNSAPESQYPYASPPFQPTYAYLPGSPPSIRQMNLKAFWIDRYPVTNREYGAFVAASGYHPQNDSNSLRYFAGGRVPNGLEDHPVVYVSYSDAKAYAEWAGTPAYRGGMAICSRSGGRTRLAMGRRRRHFSLQRKPHRH